MFIKSIMKQYHKLLQHILDNGVDKGDRTGTGTRSCFGYQMRFDLQKGFPLITTKKVFLKGIIYELLWLLKGETNIQYLCQNGVRIWDDWPYKKYKESDDFTGEDIKAFAKKIAEDDVFAAQWGDLGPVYGAQWRHWEHKDGTLVDQISNVVQRIQDKPDCRRLIVSAWNAGEIQNMALPPCHAFFQFYVSNGKLSCQLYQRSADVFLGVPFNIASYSLLTMMVAQVCGLEPGEFVHTFGDVHIYSNHFDQVQEQLSRTPKDLPTITINPNKKDIFGFEYEDFTLSGYNPDPSIKAPVAV